jgi:hypothetical protein
MCVKGVLEIFEQKSEQLKEKSEKEIKPFLEDLGRVIDKFPGMKDSQRTLAKKHFKSKKRELVLYTNKKTISLLGLPGGLPYDMRQHLAEELLPKFETFNKLVSES